MSCERVPFLSHSMSGWEASKQALETSQRQFQAKLKRQAERDAKKQAAAENKKQKQKQTKKKKAAADDVGLDESDPVILRDLNAEAGPWAGVLS